MKIEKTALLPLVDLAQCTDISHTSDILSKIIRSNKKQLSSSGKSYLAESRYKSTEEIIKQNGYQQIIELGSGFTPHAINLKNIVNHYIEVDFPKNSKQKIEIMKDLFPYINHVNYISGNIFNIEIWMKIQNSLQMYPIGIFAEGFMQYTDKKQRAFLSQQLKDILTVYNGSFFFEDSLTFHPEFSTIPDLKKLTTRMSKMSNNKNLLNYISQQDLSKEFENYGFKIKRIPAYSILSSKDYLNKEAQLIIKHFKHWQLTI